MSNKNFQESYEEFFKTKLLGIENEYDELVAAVRRNGLSCRALIAAMDNGELDKFKV